MLLIAGACALVVVAYIALYRSFLWSLLGILLATLFAGCSYFVHVVGELAAIVDYVGEPEAPLLLVLARDEDPWAATPIKADVLVEAWSLLTQTQGEDQSTGEEALERLQELYGDRVPEDLSPRQKMQALGGLVIADALPGIRGAEGDRVLGLVRDERWRELQETYARILVLDTVRVRERLRDQSTITLEFGGGDEDVVLEVRVEALVQCLEAMDCGARLRSAIDCPSQILARVNDLHGDEVDDLFDLYHGLGELFDGVRSVVPDHVGANVAIAAFLLREGAPEDAAGRAAYVAGAIQDDVLRVEPSTVLTTTASLVALLPLDSFF